ncbi:MAG: prolipoprotein diacylglyceryl transferase [Candidatus Latescibacteria bacterium]|nr:prolipoprotein diacylglyceryl transferase [Candidatus Latescibacterota bacterium]
MHPTIISFGPLAIRSYGLMLAIGFLAGILLAARRAEKVGESSEHIYNLSVWIVISSLLGSRIYYVVTHYHEYRASGNISFFRRIFVEFKNMFWPVSSDGKIGIDGLVLYGGLILATIAVAIYMKKYGLSLPMYMDILAPSIGLGEFFTRIGCFLNGCCFGRPTESFFGMVFPDNCSAGYYYPDTHIHPSQLYNSFAGLVILILLLVLERYKKFDGFTALLFFILYSAGRFIIDFTRYYEAELSVWDLSHNQLLSIVVFTIASGLLIYFSIKSRRSDS